MGSLSGAPAAAHLAALAPHLPSLGITRVGDLTGLDLLGIPVAFAARPNSRSLSVTQGKSLCPEAARLGAVMEALEQAFAERAEKLTVGRCTRRELVAQNKAVGDLSRCARVARAPRDDAPVAWARMRSLISGTRLLVPFELVGLDFRADMGWDFSGIPVSSLGLAAGPTREAAATHALLEVIEHNATAAIDVFGFLPGLAQPVSYRRGSDPALDRIVSRLECEGFDYQLFDLSGERGLPVMAALIDCPDLAQGPDIERRWIQFGGFACRFSPEHAAEAALLEAVQSRLTVIAGARDDLKPKSYLGRLRSPDQGRRAGVLLHELARDHAALRHAPAAEQLQAAMNASLSLGADDIWAADLGGIDGLAHVIRIVVPGIEASGFNAPTSLGRRTLTAMMAGAARQP